MKIKISEYKLNNDPEYAQLRLKIDEYNAKNTKDNNSKNTDKDINMDRYSREKHITKMHDVFQKNGATKTTKDKSMKKTRKSLRKNPNGFNFGIKNLNAWRAQAKVEVKREIEPIEAFFVEPKGWLNITEIAQGNGFDHHHWIKAKPVRDAVADITRAHPGLTLKTMIDAVPRSHTAYHPILASLFLETVTVKPDFKDTLKKLKERVSKSVAALTMDIPKWDDHMEDKALIADMRRTRGDLIAEEVWALEYNSDVSGFPFHTLAKKFGISVVELHQTCQDLDLITQCRDDKSSTAWRATRKGLDDKLVRELQNVNGEYTTYPWVTKAGVLAIYEELYDNNFFPADDYVVQYTQSQLAEHTFN